jgi:inosine-uridine nucleoside N-ribohydrolase
MRVLITLATALALTLTLAGCGGSEGAASKAQVIFDTDWGPDVDDVGALAVLHALADNEEADILGIAISFAGDEGPTSIDAVNTIDNISRDPVPYRLALAQEFPHDIAAADVEEPVSLYRRILAQQPDNSVTIISVGFLTNLAALLESDGDEHSPLSGHELVRQKVALYALMGGRFPKQEGGDYNLGLDQASSHAVLSQWPTPILFSGGEIGQEIITGTERLRDATTAANPVRRAFEVFNNFEGRFSWDQTAVWAAVRGPAPLWNTVDEGYFEYDPEGSYRWHATPDKDHTYLVAEAPTTTVEDVIERIMANPPGAPLPDDLQP